MTAPQFGSVGTPLAYGGSRTTSNVPVPSGVLASRPDQIVMVVMYHDGNTVSVTPPSGFAEATNSPITNTSPFGYRYRVFWKRPTAADAGNYAFTHSSTGTSGYAMRFFDCVETGDPFDVTTNASNTSNISTTVPISMTTTIDDTLLFWTNQNLEVIYSDQISGWTELADSETASTQIKVQATAGATGTIVAALTGGGTTTSAAWLGALKPKVPPVLPTRVKMRVGSDWVNTRPKTWTGSAWVPTRHKRIVEGEWV